MTSRIEVIVLIFSSVILTYARKLKHFSSVESNQFSSPLFLLRTLARVRGAHRWIAVFLCASRERSVSCINMKYSFDEDRDDSILANRQKIIY